MSLHIESLVQVNDDAWLSWFTEDEWSQFCEQTCRKIFEHLQFLHDIELSIVLTNDIEIHDLNLRFRGKDKPTNVLSFPQMTPEDLNHITSISSPIMLGDIVMGFETVMGETERNSKIFLHHFIHLLTHSVLHLLGYDHEDDDDAETMESLEIAILKTFDIKNPYQ